MANDFARLEIGETPLDILVKGDNGTVYRPRMTTAVDPFTGIIVGFYLKGEDENIPQEEDDR